MRCFGFIFVVAVAVAVVIAVRSHRQRLLQRGPATPAAVDDSPTDVAATLRELDGARTDDDSKTWATRFAEFVNSHPGRQWLVASCDHPCLSEAEAAGSARADAARKLYPLVVRRMNLSGSDASRVQRMILDDVQNARFDADRFAEQFSRPYGKVWTESILLDVSAERLDPLTDRYRQTLDAHHLFLRRRAGVGGFLIAATALTYFALNAITKGYFTGRLRIAAVAIVAVVLIVLV